MSGRRYAIRNASESDIPALLRCLRAAFEPFRTRYTREAFLDTVLTDRTARERLAKMTVLVAVDDSADVVGTIAWARESNTTGHLRGMALDPQWQGTGAAQALLDEALSSLVESGCHHVTLDTTLPLRRAVRFYEKNGFRKSGKVSDFYGMPLYEYRRDLNRRAPESADFE